MAVHKFVDVDPTCLSNKEQALLCKSTHGARCIVLQELQLPVFPVVPQNGQMVVTHSYTVMRVFLRRCTESPQGAGQSNRLDSNTPLYTAQNALESQHDMRQSSQYMYRADWRIAGERMR